MALNKTHYEFLANYEGKINLRLILAAGEIPETAAMLDGIIAAQQPLPDDFAELFQLSDPDPDPISEEQRMTETATLISREMRRILVDNWLASLTRETMATLISAMEIGGFISDSGFTLHGNLVSVGVQQAMERWNELHPEAKPLRHYHEI